MNRFHPELDTDSSPVSHRAIGLVSAAPRGIDPTLSHTMVPPRWIRTRAASNPTSVIDTWRPLGGIGGGDVDVLVDDELLVEVDVDVLVDVDVDVDVEVLVADSDGETVGDGEAQVGGIGSGAGGTGCQFGSTSIAALGAG